MDAIPAAAPVKVSKTYLSKITSFQVAWTDDVTNKKATILFVNGIYTTDDSAKQDHLEGLDGFGKFITIAPSPKDLALSKAIVLRTIAVKADADAKAAEDALAAFNPPAPLPLTSVPGSVDPTTAPAPVAA